MGVPIPWELFSTTWFDVTSGMGNRRWYYRLIDRLPVPCHDVMEWARYIETADRHVAITEIGDLRVSTVFLGIDHAFFDGSPQLFETMVFSGGDDDFYQTRCEAWDKAERMHEQGVAVATVWWAAAQAAAQQIGQPSN